MTMPIKCIVKTTHAGSPEAVLSVANVVRYTTMALLNLLPDHRPQITKTMRKLTAQYFNRSVAVSYGVNVHISVKQTSKYTSIAAGN